MLTVGRTLTAAITLADEDRALTVESCGGHDCYVLVEESYEQKHPPVDDVITTDADHGFDFATFPEDSNNYSEKKPISLNLIGFRSYAYFIILP